jgi:hypothetical protein
VEQCRREKDPPQAVPIHDRQGREWDDQRKMGGREGGGRSDAKQMQGVTLYKEVNVVRGREPSPRETITPAGLAHYHHPNHISVLISKPTVTRHVISAIFIYYDFSHSRVISQGEEGMRWVPLSATERE